ncbi:MAG: class I SAM-dependent methyltransferase [Bdellovibrionales bacterium]|nr:class I SAM-dependent methyltransferase [Bdellovibrionales bacterium]
MGENVICNLCDNPGSYADASEIRAVASHVRCFRNDIFTVWRCNNCRSLHSKEEVDLDYYYAHYPFKNHRLDYHAKIGYGNRLKLLRKNGVKRDATILDYGCGQGVYVKFLRERGFRNVQGWDPFIAEFNDQAVLENRYDVVTSHDVIEHVEDPEQYLSQLVSLVKEGGLLVLGTPNASEINLIDPTIPCVELSQPYHRHIFSKEALLRMTTRFGLVPQHVYNRFYFDSFFPAVNTRFMWSYVEAKQGIIDVAVEPPDLRTILLSPKLIFYALFGYFFRVPGNILLHLKRQDVGSLGLTQDKQVGNM